MTIARRAASGADLSTCAIRAIDSEMRERWIRSQRASVAGIGEQVLLVAGDGSVRRLDGDNAELARVVLAYFATPHGEDEVISYVESLAGPLGERRHVVSELVALLGECGALES